ncbi:PREDICTED: uncharacterized protein LOC108554144, partial [Eufriesea mexicana]|uniref:uncharacterized protein LOC108554144 n=1 Tax=Eufriesea mexicana TaxID=516756 RepID=UPI00083C2CA5
LGVGCCGLAPASANSKPASANSLSANATAKGPPTGRVPGPQPARRDGSQEEAMTLIKLGVGLADTAEPYRILDQDVWFADWDGSVAITASGLLRTPAPSLLRSSEGFVAVPWNNVVVVRCYVSPNRGLPSWEWYLDEIGSVLSGNMAPPVLVLGDFNVHRVAWGSLRTGARGEALQDWAAGLDLRLLNRGA